MQIILPKNHVLYFSSKDIQQICSPIRECFGVTTFSYVKIYPDLSRIHLDTNPEWCETFYKNIYNYFKSTGVTECNHWGSGYTLLHCLEEQECIRDAKLFNIGNGVLMSTRINDCTELVYFALNSTSTNMQVTKLINSIHLLNKFIEYFRVTACDIIKSAAKSPIILPFLINNKIKGLSYDDNLQSKFQSSINNIYSNEKLTKREYECILGYSKGLSSKQIGKLLKISPRTVDRHFENIKDKFSLNKRIEIYSRIPNLINLLKT